MQRINAVLDADEDNTPIELKKELIRLYKQYDDILTFLNKLGEQDDTKSAGISFEIGKQQSRAERPASDMAQAGGEGQGGRKLPEDLEPSYQAFRRKPKPESVPPEGETPGGVGGGTPPKQPKNFMGEHMDPGSWTQPNRSWTAKGLDSFIRNFANLQRDS